jgi:hypothetical protein
VSFLENGKINVVRKLNLKKEGPNKRINNLVFFLLKSQFQDNQITVSIYINEDASMSSIALPFDIESQLYFMRLF